MNRSDTKWFLLGIAMTLAQLAPTPAVAKDAKGGMPVHYVGAPAVTSTTVVKEPAGPVVQSTTVVKEPAMPVHYLSMPVHYILGLFGLGGAQ